MDTIGVLFVCTGNICRSPTAEGVFLDKLAVSGFADRMHVDSAGTHDYHPGKRPDSRSARAAARRGYDISGLRARVVEVADFARFDYVLAMDRSNYHGLARICPDSHSERLRMFLSFAPQLEMTEVPDPYYGGASGFEDVLDVIELASIGLVEHLADRFRDGS